MTARAGHGPQLNQPRDVVLRGASDFYIADTDNCRVRLVSGGTISTVAGTGTCGFSGDPDPDPHPPRPPN